MKKAHELDLEIEKMFADATPQTKADLESFAEKNRALMDKPSFKAGVLKDQFIHTILEALNEEGINQSELAKRCGKSRQAMSKQLDESKPGNFTVDTIEIEIEIVSLVTLKRPKVCCDY